MLTKRQVRKDWKKWNKRLFAGILPMPDKIVIMPADSETWGMAEQTTDGKWILYLCCSMSKKKYKNVLTHEMLHFVEYLFDITGKKMHSKWFLGWKKHFAKFNLQLDTEY